MGFAYQPNALLLHTSVTASVSSSNNCIKKDTQRASLAALIIAKHGLLILLDPAITLAKGLTNCISYMQISSITKIRNKRKWHKGAET